MDESTRRVGRRERREDENGEDDESRIPVVKSTEAGSVACRQSAEREERVTAVFDDMDEPTVEIAVWTTAREEALNKVTEDAMADDGEL